jgi:glutamate/tyrosine decarboxylase-like PLP-dependent enzyme
MNSVLTNDHENLGAILSSAKDMAESYFVEQQTLPPGRFIENIPMEDLPETGMGALAALQRFGRDFAPRLNNSAGPRYFGFVTGGSTPAAIAGDWLVSAYDQNAAGSNDSIAPQMERQTIHFFKQLFGLDEEFFGTFVTGATVSNATNLAVARQWAGQQIGIDFSEDGLWNAKGVKVLSGTPHSSIAKSLSMIGIGRNAFVKVDVLPDREAIDIASLEALLQAHSPAIVVANAGTVNTVDFDDLLAIGQLKSKYNFWLHVDAAFGGFASCSEKYAHYLTGLNYADSVTVDAHKWLNVPYDAAMQFTRHRHLQLRVFQNSAAYLGDPAQSPDFFHYTPENSRRFRALPSWFTLMAYGREGYREIIERNCAAAQYLGSLIKESSEFQLLSPVRMNVVCFTFLQEGVKFEGIQRFLDHIRDEGRAYFTPTIYKGRPAIRAAVSNWLTSQADVIIAFKELTDAAENAKSAYSAAAQNDR